MFRRGAGQSSEPRPVDRVRAFARGLTSDLLVPLFVTGQLDHPALKTNGLLFPVLRDIVAEDKKTRTALEHRGEGAPAGDGPEGWFIRANQGHSVKLDAMEDGMKRVTEVEEAGEAVHGTTGLDAWKGIC